MSNFIEDFYYGNIEPQECTTNLTAKIKKSLSELADKEDQLASILANKEKELFTDYVATYIKFSSTCNADSYVTKPKRKKPFLHQSKKGKKRA